MSVVKLTKTPVPNVLDLSLFLAFKKGDDGIYRHYITFICDKECYDTRISLPEIRFENTRSMEDTLTLFCIREDKIDVSLEKDVIPSLELQD